LEPSAKIICVRLPTLPQKDPLVARSPPPRSLIEGPFGSASRAAKFPSCARSR
jgi:hypothetical protein